MRMSRPALVLLLALHTPAIAQEVGHDATRSLVTIIGVGGQSKRVVLDSARRFDAPGWSPDGSSLILNAGGKLWRLPVAGGQEPKPIPTGQAGWIDINHGISPDGKTLALTSNARISLVRPTAASLEPCRPPSPATSKAGRPTARTSSTPPTVAEASRSSPSIGRAGPSGRSPRVEVPPTPRPTRPTVAGSTSTRIDREPPISGESPRPATPRTRPSGSSPTTARNGTRALRPTASG